MAFHITHRYGDMESSESVSILAELLRELDDDLEDTEHDSVSVSHESEWSMSVWRGGYVVFEHLENGGTADPMPNSSLHRTRTAALLCSEISRSRRAVRAGEA